MQTFPSQNVIHRALACHDILEQVTFHVEAVTSYRGRSRVVSRFSLVNKAFNAFFTEKLWGTLPSIIPLLRLLSPMKKVTLQLPDTRQEYVRTHVCVNGHALMSMPL